MVTGKRVASGRLDILHISGEVALLQDIKSGFSKLLPAKHSAQLKLSAVAVALEYIQITKVIVQLISPYYGVSEHVYSLEDGTLQAAYRDVVWTLERINKPDAKLNPDATACRYCTASAICPALKALAEPVKADALVLPDGERASKLLEETELLSRQIEEVRAYYTRRIKDGHEIPGWGLVVGTPRRRVTDWPAARSKLEEHIATEELDKLAVYSIPEVEHLLGEALHIKGLKLKQQLQTVLGDLMHLKYPEPTLQRVEENKELQNEHAARNA